MMMLMMMINRMRLVQGFSDKRNLDVRSKVQGDQWKELLDQRL